MVLTSSQSSCWLSCGLMLLSACTSVSRCYGILYWSSDGLPRSQKVRDLVHLQTYPIVMIVRHCLALRMYVISLFLFLIPLLTVLWPYSELRKYVMFSTYPKNALDCFAAILRFRLCVAFFCTFLSSLLLTDVVFLFTSSLYVFALGTRDYMLMIHSPSLTARTYVTMISLQMTYWPS